MKITGRIVAAIAALALAAPVGAAPPPPPLPATLDAVQGFVKALTENDYAAYESVLAQDFEAHKTERDEILDREAWLEEMKTAFENRHFSVKVMRVFEGSAKIDGQYLKQVLLVERASNIAMRGDVPGDCCVYFLTETLTLDGDKIIRIDRSSLFTNELSPEGKRTDLG